MTEWMVWGNYPGAVSHTYYGTLHDALVSVLRCVDCDFATATSGEGTWEGWYEGDELIIRKGGI